MKEVITVYIDVYTTLTHRSVIEWFVEDGLLIIIDEETDLIIHYVLSNVLKFECKYECK